jgi:hypothetical protein
LSNTGQLFPEQKLIWFWKVSALANTRSLNWQVLFRHWSAVHCISKHLKALEAFFTNSWFQITLYSKWRLHPCWNWYRESVPWVRWRLPFWHQRIRLPLCK